ncbi:hypothetical protein HN587_00770 [Candidatus Woesearchaeota archaeon]|nr:hypothetical protein [Candidatus Woesearchaeota archaeon]
MRFCFNNKKAYVRTLEAFLAFFLTFAFLVFIIYGGPQLKIGLEELNVLHDLEPDPEFRTCVEAMNSSCVSDLVDLQIAKYEFEVTINELQPFANNYDTRVEQLFFVGNQSRDFKIVKLYYWNPG